MLGWRARGAVLTVAILVATLPLTAPAAGAAPAQRGPERVAEGLDVASKSLYVLDPGTHSVHVTIDTTVTNQAAPIGSSYSVLTGFAIPALAEATGVTASRDGEPLDVALESTESPYFASARIQLSPPLLYRDSQVLHLTYDIPGLAPRSPGISRNNDAFATFAVIPLADPGQADVEIDVPHRFSLETTGGDLDLRSDQVTDRYTAEAIADPLGFNLLVAASDDTALTTREVAAADSSFTVRAWPDDPAWGDFVTEWVGKGVPDLVNRVGLAYPDPKIDVYETSAPYLYGYAGWYLKADHRVDIGDELEPLVVIHELSHAWLNADLIDSRWVEEGLAQELAAQVVAASGGNAPDPLPADPNDPGVLRLEEWSHPNLSASISDDQERYGYNAAYLVVHQIAAEIGPDKMRAVIKAAHDDVVAYRGDGEPEAATGDNGWERFLDYADQLGGSTSADQLARDLVATPDQVGILDNRAGARDTYAQLAAVGDGWSVPYPVRAAMGEWHFDEATALMDQAAAILPVRTEIAAVLEPIGVPLPGGLEREYETGDDLATIAADAAATLDASRTIVTADSAVHGDRGLWESIGGGGADAHLAAAKQALERGDPAKATTEA
ncbi:MAG: hypothetical protein ABIV94_11085, partial [Acidimicrobiales bacterium]